MSDLLKYLQQFLGKYAEPTIGRMQGQLDPYGPEWIQGQLARTRDVVEPAAQNWLAGALRNLYGRGMESSTLAGGAAGQAARAVQEAMQTKAWEASEQGIQERWKRLIDLLGGISQTAASYGGLAGGYSDLARTQAERRAREQANEGKLFGMLGTILGGAIGGPAGAAIGGGIGGSKR